MKVWTYGEVRTRVEDDLDLQDEDFITPNELAGYYNEAVAAAEAKIHSLNVEDDYFLTSAAVTLTAGQSEYDLHTILPDLYGLKIRGLIYSSGGTIYEIPRLRRLRKFTKVADILQNGASLEYCYLIKHVKASATDQKYKLVLLPASRETGAVVTGWYIRNANRVALPGNTTPTASDTTTLDIPEFSSFIIDYMKAKCLGKEVPSLDAVMASLSAHEEQMINTLTPAVVDDNDSHEMDTSFYEEMN